MNLDHIPIGYTYSYYHILFILDNHIHRIIHRVHKSHGLKSNCKVPPEAWTIHIKLMAISCYIMLYHAISHSPIQLVGLTNMILRTTPYLLLDILIYISYISYIQWFVLVDSTWIGWDSHRNRPQSAAIHPVSGLDQCFATPQAPNLAGKMQIDVAKVKHLVV